MRACMCIFLCTYLYMCMEREMESNVFLTFYLCDYKDATEETSLARSHTEDSGPHHPVTGLETFPDYATLPR